jgi:EmrB/QacA subfamily drug resistance transporter
MAGVRKKPQFFRPFPVRLCTYAPHRASNPIYRFVAVPRHFLIALIVGCALFMENIDSTVLSTSLPFIARDLGESPTALKLTLISYLVSLAVFIPISGWMADRFGSRRIFCGAVIVFMAGSLLCAMANSSVALVVFRFLQGVGGAMMVPVGRLVLLKSTEKKDIVAALSYLTLPALLGPIIGPPLGGFITTYFHWRWIFLVNIPISLLGLFLIARYIPDLREDDVPPLDFRGFTLAAFGLSALMLGFASAGEGLFDRTVAPCAVLFGALSMVAYAWHARRTEHPLFQLELFRLPTFRAGVLGGVVFRLGTGATPFLLPLMFQLGFGFTPLMSGLLTCASTPGAMLMKTIARVILHWFGFRRVLIANALITAFFIMSYGLFSVQTVPGLILGVLLLGECFRALQFTGINAITYAQVPSSRMSGATSLASMAQQLSIAAGVTVGGVVLQFVSRLQDHAALTMMDFRWSFLIVGLISIGSIAFIARLEPDAGAELARRVKA